MVNEIIDFLLEDAPERPDEEIFGDEGWKEVSDVSVEVTRPTRFRKLPIGSRFKMHDGTVAVKINDTDIRIQEPVPPKYVCHPPGVRGMGNPLYVCYPPEWDIATIKSAARHIDKQPHLVWETEDEDLDAQDAKDVHVAEPIPEFSLSQIRAAQPKFFSRSSMRFHGTRKVYKYKGNYVVLHNRKESHRGFGQYSTDENWPIYQWKTTPDSPEGDLFFKAHAKDLDDAKEMIKTGDFRSRRQRLGLPESEDDDLIKDVADSSEVVRETEHFRMVREGDKHFLQAQGDVHPKTVEIAPADIFYLRKLSASEFNGAAVFDYGCGVFAGPDPDQPE